MPLQKHEKLWHAETIWWPPQPDTEYGGECLRGVWCDGPDGRRGIIRSLPEAQDLLSQLHEYLDSPDATRVQVKAIVENGLLPELASQPDWQSVVESCFPLDGCGDEFAGSTLLYLGWNAANRQEKTKSEHWHKVELARQEQPRPLHQLQERLSADFSLRRITVADLPTVEGDLQNLWIKFGFSPEKNQSILRSAENIVIGAFHNGQLVSVGRAKLMPHCFNDVPFVLCEHTDAATLPEHEGRGLYGAILATQMSMLAALPEPPHLLVGETNVTSLPALKISRRVGREFGLDHARRLGFSGGLMRQDVMIVGEDGLLRYKDLAPAFMSREALLAVTGTTLR